MCTPWRPDTGASVDARQPIVEEAVDCVTQDPQPLKVLPIPRPVAIGDVHAGSLPLLLGRRRLGCVRSHQLSAAPGTDAQAVAAANSCT